MRRAADRARHRQHDAVKTAEAFLDHGRVERTIDQAVDGARETLEAFAAVGIDYDVVVNKLERESVEKFVAAFQGRLDGIAGKRDARVAH